MPITLGIKLTPSMRRLGDTVLYQPAKDSRYTHRRVMWDVARQGAALKAMEAPH